VSRTSPRPARRNDLRTGQHRKTAKHEGEPSGDFYTRRNPDRTKQRALDQLKKLGYDVTLTPVETAVTKEIESS
jgi:hypothetical protein